MSQEIKIGSILIRENMVFPAGVSVESDAFLPGWKLVRDLNGYELARMIVKANWNFFYLAGEIRAMTLGRGGSAAFRRTLRRIVAKREGQNYNSLEITRVVAKRFLGIPFLSIAANSRHIQEGIGLVPTRNFVLRMPVPAPNEEVVTKRYTAMISSS
ncbi:MAG TPA: hypothetical protein VN025_19945 [Candidatus Dormibacteraeota bacterium]|jgi:hypothetical protein|nr:hypothetical protein [Candidatus Dormibacteraeota bacterium]